MEIDHTEGTKGNIIALETNYNNLLSRVNVLGETSVYYLGLIPELENEIHNISMHIRSIERYQNEIKGGITVNDKLSMLPDNIQKLITKKPLVEFVIDPVLMEIQKDTMISLISEYQRLIAYLEKKVTLLEYGQQSKENNAEPLTQKGIEKIGLFVRSGIISFLKEKNPNITNTQLSKFLRELTSEYLENSESTRPHLTTNTNSEKHPFYANGRLNRLDLILKKYGIEPQADN